MTHDRTINFTPASLVRLKALYEKHKADDVMIFDGVEIVPSYAKYLIQYLEGKFSE